MDFRSIVRVTHLLSAAALCGQVVINFYSEDKMNQKIKSHDLYSSFQNFISILVFVTGGLMILHAKNGKSLKDPVHNIWLHFFEIKFVLSTFLTPLVYPFTSILADEGESQISEEFKNKLQFYLVIFMCVYSTFTKYFREEVCHNFEKDIVLEKVQELQDRYN